MEWTVAVHQCISYYCSSVVLSRRSVYVGLDSVLYVRVLNVIWEFEYQNEFWRKDLHINIEANNSHHHGSRRRSAVV